MNNNYYYRIVIHIYDHDGMIVMLISTSEMLSGDLLGVFVLLI